MTKNEVREMLQHGKTLEQIFPFTDGQDCLIYKSELFVPDENVCYIPDIYLNEIPVSKDLSVDIEGIFDAIGNMYTGKDFMDLCGGNFTIAARLFYYCDWQHPSSAYDEYDWEEEYETEMSAM